MVMIGGGCKRVKRKVYSSSKCSIVASATGGWAGGSSGRDDGKSNSNYRNDK